MSFLVVSAVEDPERKPAVAAGFRGGRYISAEASSRGEWEPCGAKKPGFDAYATSKQAILAAAMAFARGNPRLHFNAVEPGLNLTTGLGGGDAGTFVHFLQRFVIPLLVPLLMPFIKILSTPERAARVTTKILVDAPGQTGVKTRAAVRCKAPRWCMTRSSRIASWPRHAPYWPLFLPESRSGLTSVGRTLFYVSGTSTPASHTASGQTRGIKPRPLWISRGCNCIFRRMRLTMLAKLDR